MPDQDPFDPAQHAAPPPPGSYPPPPPPPFLHPGYSRVSPYPPDAGAPYGRDPYGRPLSDKSKLVAGLLQIFLGTLGIGRFYTGHVGIAVAQLLTCGGLGVWALVDGILFLVKDDGTDAKGFLLRA